jgi:propanediol utilization protein
MLLSSDELINRITDRVARTLSKPQIPLEASGRHMHVSKADLEVLFGPGHRLTKGRDLSQPGQFSCVERVRVIGPRGELPSVVILGPERPETQVEISLTDAKILGIDVPVRLSGDTAGTPGIKIAGPAGELDIPRGVIAAKRHIHLNVKEAEQYGLNDGQAVSIRFYGERGITFHEVPVRVSQDFATVMHIDYDEANAIDFRKGTVGFLDMEVRK